MAVILRVLRPAFASVLVLAGLTGVAYPLAVLGLAQAAFPRQAGGSLLRREGQVVGSSLLGQVFTDAGDFWGRPSATVTPAGEPWPCDAGNSGGSNLAPGNPALRGAVAARVAALMAADPEQREPVPVDLVTASGSGLDPHLSPAAVLFQAHRVAKARGLPEATVRALVAAHTEGRQLGLLGEPRVNVLLLNLALDALQAR
jgi:K+-transporting ATPase ATPase C chain